DLDELLGVLLHGVGDREQGVHPVRRRRGTPVAAVGRARAVEGGVDVGGPRQRRRRVHLAGRRVHDVERAAVGGGGRLAVDDVGELHGGSSHFVVVPAVSPDSRFARYTGSTETSTSTAAATLT